MKTDGFTILQLMIVLCITGIVATLVMECAYRYVSNNNAQEYAQERLP